MKEIQTKSGKILVVEIPENSNTFELISQGFYLRYKTGVFNNIIGTDDTRDIDLRGTYIFPEYKIIGKLSELTDKDCEDLVENDEDSMGAWYKNYNDRIDNKPPYSIETAKESFISLLQSEGIDVSKEYLIIKIL